MVIVKDNINMSIWWQTFPFQQWIATLVHNTPQSQSITFPVNASQCLPRRLGNWTRCEIFETQNLNRKIIQIIQINDKLKRRSNQIKQALLVIKVVCLDIDLYFLLWPSLFFKFFLQILNLNTLYQKHSSTLKVICTWFGPY